MENTTNDDLHSPKSKIADLYNRVSSDYSQIGPRILDDFGQRLVELAGVSSGATILDVASGRGASLFPAIEGAYPDGRVMGSDIAFGMAHETWQDCQQRGMANGRMLQMDGDYVAFKSASFDYVMCGFAIFLFPKPEHTMREWYRVLASGGKVGICVASGGDERWKWYEELLYAYHQKYHFPLSAGGNRLRDPIAIKSLMEQVGFGQTTIIEETDEYGYASLDEWWQAKWTHGARYPLEQMDADVLIRFKAEVFEHAQEVRASHGLREKWTLAYIFGEK